MQQQSGNHNARISFKLVSQVGVGVVAIGVTVIRKSKFWIVQVLVFHRHRLWNWPVFRWVCIGSFYRQDRTPRKTLKLYFLIRGKLGGTGASSWTGNKNDSLSRVGFDLDASTKTIGNYLKVELSFLMTFHPIIWRILFPIYGRRGVWLLDSDVPQLIDPHTEFSRIRLSRSRSIYCHRISTIHHHLPIR